jgi:hypothetical protein
VRCGLNRAESASLDTAIIETLRGVPGADVHGHAASDIDWGTWVRERAQAIEDLRNLGE